MDLAVCLVWEHDQIANLHFMDKAEELPGIIRNCTSFFFGIGLRHRSLISIASRC